MSTSILRENDSVRTGFLIASQNTVFANSRRVIINNDRITPHDPPPHDNARIIASSNNVFIGGISVARSTNIATCGDIAISDSNVFVG